MFNIYTIEKWANDWAKKGNIRVPTRCSLPRRRYVSSSDVVVLRLGEPLHLGEG